MELEVQKTCQQLAETKLTDLTDSTKRVNSEGNDQDEVSRIQVKYNRLVTKAKQLASEGQVRAALELNQRALKLHHNEKLAKRIAKMEAYLKEYGESSGDEEDDGMVHVGEGFHLYKDLFDKLYSHQREGVTWMWRLNKQKKGGILGDDMGLGKTIQVIAFLSGLFDMQKVHAALLVMPVSVMVNWEKEFQKWAPGIRVQLYHGNSKKEKERALAKIQRRGGVCITSYGLVVTSSSILSEQDGREFRWDYLILDEGHKIKNPTKTTKGVQEISARNRLILTGTPVQNNLKELWALFDFVHQGSLLGTARTFKMEFENPITRARERDATAGERRLGMEMAEGLKKIIAPYFLRRTKAEVKAREASQGTDEKDSAVKMPSMTRKNDLIIWLFLTPTQQQIYQDFLSLDSVKEISRIHNSSNASLEGFYRNNRQQLLMTKKSPLVALTVLKKICDHPRLLSTRACAQLGLDGEDGMAEEDLDTPEAHQCAANQINHIEDEVLVKESGKLIVVVELLDNLKSEGHRCLLFSQSRKILDIIQKIIRNRGHKVMRLDGTVTSIEERDQRIRKFQNDESYSVFLLTTQVGGVGLTLTAADRVIIFDPSWNPATDEQAVDRVFRIGQDKNVVIYRLITCGTVEEKIYRRQIFKDSITRQTTGTTKNPYRYFTKQELRELFMLDTPRHSTTQQQLEEMHSSNRKTDQSLDSHIAYLYSLDIFGISDHDLMFSQDHSSGKRDDELDEDDVPEVDSNDYIQHRVQKAQELIRMESSVSTTFNHQEQVKAPRIGEPRPLNWPGPELFVPKEEEDVDRKFNVHQVKVESDDEEPVKEEEENQSTSCIDLTSPDNSIHEDTPSPNQSVEQEIVDLSLADQPIKNELRRSIKQEEFSPYFKEIKKETENIEMENSPDKHKDLGVLPNLVNVKTEMKSPVSDKSLDSSMVDIRQSLEENKENISPDVDRIKTESLSPDVRVTNQSLTSHNENTEFNDVKTPSKREKRKSVSKSPWLQRTPKSKSRKVIEEEIFISPDASKPIVKTEPKLSFKSPLTFRNNARLNSTILTAFSDSPDVGERSGSSSGDSTSESPAQSRLGMTFVGDSPDFRKDRLHMTFVGESPDSSNNSLRHTHNNSTITKVVESVQNTPAVSHCNKSENSNVCVVDSTDEEVTPEKSFQDSPIHSVKNRQKVRKAVIESSDEENDSGDNLSRSHNMTVENNMTDSLSDGKCRSRNTVIDDSEEESCEEDEVDLKMKRDNNVSHTNRLKKSVIKSSDEEVGDNNDTEMNISYNDSRTEEKMDLSDCDMDKKVASPSNSFAMDDLNDHSGERENRTNKKGSSLKQFVDNEACGDKVNSSGGSEIEDDDTDLSGFVVDGESTEEEEDSEGDESVEDQEDDDENHDDDFDDLSDEMKTQFKELVKNGRSLYKSGQYESAIVYVLQALEIYPDNRLQVLALKIHQKLAE